MLWGAVQGLQEIAEYSLVESGFNIDSNLFIVLSILVIKNPRKKS